MYIPRRMCSASMIGTYFTVYGGIISIEHYRAGETITSPRIVAHGYPGATWPAIRNSRVARSRVHVSCVYTYIHVNTRMCVDEKKAIVPMELVNSAVIGANSLDSYIVST